MRTIGAIAFWGQVEALGNAVLSHVTANPGPRMGEIAKALNVTAKDVRLPTLQLVDAGKLRTTGQRGGTRYFPKARATKKGPKKGAKK